MPTLTELFGSMISSLAATRAAQPSAILLRNTTAFHSDVSSCHAALHAHCNIRSSLAVVGRTGGVSKELRNVVCDV